MFVSKYARPKFNQEAVRTQGIHLRFIGPYYLDEMRDVPAWPGEVPEMRKTLGLAA